MQYSTGGLWETAYRSQVITLIGAGGKTTALLRIAQELSSQGIRVLATTTTKVYPMDFPTIWADGTAPPNDVRYPCFWYARENTEGKWIGPSIQEVESAIYDDKYHNNKRVWIIEGDGARSLSLKCWAGHEPQIPFNTDCVVLMLSADLWGKALVSKDVHRPEYCEDLIGQTWNTQTLWNYLHRSPVYDMKFKRVSWVVLFNVFSETEEEILEEIKVLKSMQNREVHGDHRLPRFAVGNVKEGLIRWLDLL